VKNIRNVSYLTELFTELTGKMSHEFVRAAWFIFRLTTQDKLRMHIDFNQSARARHRLDDSRRGDSQGGDSRPQVNAK
jgi:hypothetical protein